MKKNNIIRAKIKNDCFRFKRIKKGSHTGFVLSFIIFIIFIVFLLAILQSAFRIEDKERVLGTLRIELFRNFTVYTNITHQNYRLHNTTSLNTNFLSIRLTNIIGNGPLQLPRDYINETHTRYHFWDENSNMFLNHRQYGGVHHLLVGDWESTEQLVQNGYNITITILDEWVLQGPVSNSPQGHGYGNGTFIEEVTIIGEEEEWDWLPEQQIVDTFTLYEENYEELKDTLNIPPGMDFAFNFTLANGTTLSTRWNIPPGIKIFIEKYPVTYQDRGLQLRMGILTIGAW